MVTRYKRTVPGYYNMSRSIMAMVKFNQHNEPSNSINNQLDGRDTIESIGMKPFLLWYRHIGGGIHEELDESTCCPFPSKYPSYLNYLPDCHPHHAWITMETIWKKVRMDRLN
eukprot:scaffold25804_cov58-Attheya_sp.AAC.6